jgi:hypothetical protein
MAPYSYGKKQGEKNNIVHTPMLKKSVKKRNNKNREITREDVRSSSPIEKIHTYAYMEEECSQH